jgi:hypothetical protein
MSERDSEINFKKWRWYIFLSGFAIFVVLVGIVKQIIIFFN